jgi:hypothetical protein
MDRVVTMDENMFSERDYFQNMAFDPNFQKFLNAEVIGGKTR